MNHENTTNQAKIQERDLLQRLEDWLMRQSPQWNAHVRQTDDFAYQSWDFEICAKTPVRVEGGRFVDVDSPQLDARIALRVLLERALGGAPSVDQSRHTPQDKGPWKAGFVRGEASRVFLESDDFTHDVRLYVDGDFASAEDKLAYAQDIARQLNNRV